MRLGDAVAVVAQPIARGIDYVFGTDFQHCSGCYDRQQFLNRISDHFWSKERVMTEYIIIKQIAVMADSPEDAVAKIKDGKTIGFQVTERPQPPQPRITEPPQVRK